MYNTFRTSRSHIIDVNELQVLRPVISVFESADSSTVMASSRVDQPKLMIKVLDTQEAVAFDLSNLPSADEILDVLAAEAAPLTVWFDFARAFLAQGNQDGFLAICDQGTKEETISEVSRTRCQHRSDVLCMAPMQAPCSDIAPGGTLFWPQAHI